MADYYEEFFVAGDLAQQVGAAIYNIYFGRLEKKIKDDGTVVTNADLHAEEIISEQLRNRFPHDGIVSEEGTREQINAERVWYIDPLDGTRGFTQRSDQFATHIGLAVQGEPVLGIVYKPLIREGYTAIKGDGAYRRSPQGKQLKLQVKADSPPPTFVFDCNTLLADYWSALREILFPGKVIITGSEGLRVMKVAEGLADVRFSTNHSQSHTWDLCAPHIIAQEAGAYVAYVDGKPIRYTGQNELENNFVVARSEELGRSIGDKVQRFLEGRKK